MPTIKEIMDQAVSDEEMTATFPSDTAAFSVRHRCYRWRLQQRKQGIFRYDDLVIRKVEGEPVLVFSTLVDDVVLSPPKDPEAVDPDLLADAQAVAQGFLKERR